MSLKQNNTECLLGIDFSIKSTAIALKNDNQYTFYSFARNSVAKPEIFSKLSEVDVIIKTLNDEPSLNKKALTAERERSSLNDMKHLIPHIIETFKDYSISQYAIEGFSFGSTGNRLAQISGYQWVLRWELNKLGIDTENFWTFAPLTVKSVAGKGNFSKEQMIESFVNSEDSLLQTNKFWLTLKNSPEVFQNKKGVFLKPIDDLIDSWWILKTLEKNIS